MIRDETTPMMADEQRWQRSRALDKPSPPTIWHSHILPFIRDFSITISFVLTIALVYYID